jgi:hypothetical protein
MKFISKIGISVERGGFQLVHFHQRRRDMRSLICAALAAASVLAVTAPVSTASAQEYKYCLQGKRWGYPGNCQFSTYQHCMVTASGTVDYCDINPRYAARERGRYR